MHSSKKKYLELLKKKSINLHSEKDSRELSKYSVMLNSQLDWESRDQYLELIENFLKDEISISEFCSQVLEKGQASSDAVEFLESKLILLSINAKSLEFSELLEEIFDECDYFDGEEDLTGEEFRNAIEGSFVKIQNYLTEECICL